MHITKGDLGIGVSKKVKTNIVAIYKSGIVN